MRRERADPASAPGCGQAGNSANRAVQTMKDKTELAETEPGAMLVHGATGSSWSAVIQRLQGAGLAVIAV
jgi:hypothetical protein